MKYIVLAILFAASFAYADNTFTPQNVWDGVKESYPGSEPFNLRQGGEDISTATVIPGIPFTDTGTTVGYLNNYDEICPYGPHTTPDVVYAYAPTVDEVNTIDLCMSYYDTKVFVYQDSWTPGAPWACNDDYCMGPNFPYSYLSYIEQVPMYAGHTYYIVVDGYGGSVGTYVLDIYPYEECETPCPAGGIAEGEPTCFPGYTDPYNGGCNSSPYIFQTVLCPDNPVVYCGETGNWVSGYTYYRDTDWYEITLTETKTITASVEAEFNVLMFLLDGNPTPGPDPCLDGDIIIIYSTSTPCVPFSLTWTFAPGTYWVWVGPSSFYDGIPCAGPGNRYVLTIDGYCPDTGTEQGSWGQVKTLFR
ncbi:MAG: hypothetical protein ABIH26_12925 [Candidatus Eisenbacteria bacterium]